MIATNPPAPPPATTAPAADRASARLDSGQSSYTAWHWLLAGGVFLVAFLFRWLSLPIGPGWLGFDNDQFYHLVRARQTLTGELPFRDFHDPGIFLRIYTSTAMQLLFGHNLLGELLLCVGLLAASAALAFLLAARLTGSVPLGLVSAILLVATLQRPHNYPKIFVPLAALWFIWSYVDRPSGRRLALLALATTTAFLFRHDYGIYVFIASLAALVVTHSRDFGRLIGRAALYGGSTALLLLPFLLFLQLNGGVDRYFAGVGSYVQDHGIGRLRAPWVDLVTPAPGPPVKVRWADGLSEQSRAELEARYRLVGGRAVGGRTREYALADQSRSNVRALVTDRRVDDTEGVDRRTYEVTSSNAFFQGWRWRPEAWLATLFALLPAIGLVLLGLKWVGRRAGGGLPTAEAAKVASLLALAGAANPVLLREVSGSRVADSAAPATLLAVWLLHNLIGERAGWSRPRSPSTPRPQPPSAFQRLLGRSVFMLGRLTRVALAAALVVVTGLSLWASLPLESYLQRSALLGSPSMLTDRASEVIGILGTTPPLELAASPGAGGAGALMRYVAACTTPTDRLLVAADARGYQFYFFSGRGFAAGRPAFERGQFASAEDQQLSLRRLQAQYVPIAIVDAQRDPLRQDFRVIQEHLSANYQVVLESPGDSRSETTYRVLVDRRMTPTSIYGPLQLPCYA